MNHVEIYTDLRNYDCRLPSCWEEIQSAKWPALARFVAGGDIYYRDVVFLLGEYKTRFGWRPLPKGLKKTLPAPELGLLFGCLSWMLLDPCITPIKKRIKVNGRWYHLPGPAMRNTVIIEFATADMCYEVSRMYSGKNRYRDADLWLNKMCAYICRPIDPTINELDPERFAGDLREKFNSAIIEKRMAEFNHISPEDRYQALMFFTGTKRHMRSQFKYVWPRTHTDSGEALMNVTVSNKPEPKRWLNAIRRLAGGKYGDYEKTCYTPTYVIMEEIEQQLQTNLTT